MIRVTPKQVVEFIDRAYGWAARGQNPGSLSFDNAGQVAALVDLVDRIPSELLPEEQDARLRFAYSVSILRGTLYQWQGATTVGSAAKIGNYQELDHKSPIGVIRGVLSRGRDSAPAPDTHFMPFIRDPLIRESIRQDLSDAKRDFERGSYKGATVLAGAALEAILLDAVERIPPVERDAALKRWKASSKRPTDPKPPETLRASVADWSLHQLIWIAESAGLISIEAASAADVGRDFRNLIHPGKLRTSVPADEGSASLAIGGALRVIAELSQRVE